MTRLTEQDIKQINNTWLQFENKLKNTANCTLLELALSTLNLNKTIINLIARCKVAIVPISHGEGFIPSFANSLNSIAQHLGFETFITQTINEEGFQEAQNKEAQLTLSADDDYYLAKSAQNNSILSENGSATGRAFAEILRKMSKNNFANGDILIIGCGDVGLAAAQHLKKFKEKIYFSDLNEQKTLKVSQQLSGLAISPQELKNNWPTNIKYILDASTASFFNYKLADDVLISAPGVPLAWPKTENMWHDPLQSGTAVMLLEALSQI